MILRLSLISIIVCAVLALAAESPVEPLPDPVSNNAVAILKLHGQFALFSLACFLKLTTVRVR